MMKTNGKVNDIFRSKQFDICAKDSGQKSAVDRAIESLCNEQRMFVEDIMRCDVKEEIASELLRSCTSIENALAAGDKEEFGAPSILPVPEKDQDDEISIFNIDVNYVDICLDIDDTSRVDEVFKEKKDRLEKKIRELNGSNQTTIDELETCMTKRDEIIISQSSMHKDVLDLCKSIRQIESDMLQITKEVCITPETTDAVVVRFDCKDQLQKIVKLQRKVDKVRNMSMLKGCHLLICREGNKRLIKENGLLKEDLKKLIDILRDLDREYKKIQSDLCDSDNISKKTSGESIKDKEKKPTVRTRKGTKETPYKKEVVIVKPDVGKKRNSPGIKKYTEEPAGSNEIKVYESTIPGDLPPNPDPRAPQKIQVYESTIPGDFPPDPEVSPSGRAPDAIEIIPYEAIIPGDTPHELPREHTQRDQSPKKDAKKENIWDGNGFRDKEFKLTELLPLPDNDKVDGDLTLEIRSYDNESDTTDEIPFRGREIKPDSKRKKAHEQPTPRGKDISKAEERIQEEKRNDKPREHVQEDTDKDSLPPYSTEVKVYDGSLPGDDVYDGDRYGPGELIPIIPYEAQISGNISVKSAFRQKERKDSNTASKKSARFASNEKETEDEEDENIDQEDDIKKIKVDCSDKPPPGGAAGGIGRSSPNQSNPTSTTKGNRGNTSRQQSKNQRNSYGGGKRNNYDEAKTRQTVGDFIRDGISQRKRGQRGSVDSVDKTSTTFQNNSNTEELIGDQAINVSAPGLVNDDHIMTVMHHIDQAIKSQKINPEFAKMNEKDLDQIKMMNDWKRMFKQYQQTYSVLVTAKRDYQKKYEETLTELAKYKEDYSLLKKANSGAEEIVDEISALKRLNSALEDRINSTLTSLRRKEQENQNLLKENEKFTEEPQKSFDSIACSSMESLRYIQKISQLESKIAFLTNQNEMILRKYEDSQQKLSECEKNLRKITEKMLKPPKDLIVPLIPAKDASYKEWANYSKYITERLNDFQVALARSNFMLKLVEDERAKLSKENDSQKCALQSSFESLKRVQAEQNSPSLTQQVELLTQEVEKQANALKIKEDESARLVETNKTLSERVEKMEETVKYYRKCVERLNFMKEGISRMQSSVPEESQLVDEQTKSAEAIKDSKQEYISNQTNDANELLRRPNKKAIGVTSSALHKVVLNNSKRVHWNLVNSSSINNPRVKPNRDQVPRSSSDCHEFKLLHNFLQKEISKCIEKIHAKGCPQPIRQELEEIKNNLEWSKRKVNEMLGTDKKKTNDQNALQLQKVCEKMIQSGAESLSPKELMFLYNVVYTTGKERSQKTKNSEKGAVKKDNSIGMKKWKDLEADINLTRHMLDKFKSGRKN